jgi:hypothetical protein
VPFKSKSRLKAENAALRHQLIVLRRNVKGRVRLMNNDRRFFIQLYRWFPSILQVLTVIRPETLVRWHRAGFRCYWSWKSRPSGGRPQIETDLRALIRRMSIENPLWGAPRISVDPRRAPQRIGNARLADQPTDLQRRSRPAATAARAPAPIRPKPRTARSIELLVDPKCLPELLRPRIQPVKITVQRY